MFKNSYTRWQNVLKHLGHTGNVLYPLGKMKCLSEPLELVAKVEKPLVLMWTVLDLFEKTGEVPHHFELMANV